MIEKTVCFDKDGQSNKLIAKTQCQITSPSSKDMKTTALINTLHVQNGLQKWVRPCSLNAFSKRKNENKSGGYSSNTMYCTAKHCESEVTWKVPYQAVSLHIHTHTNTQAHTHAQTLSGLSAIFWTLGRGLLRNTLFHRRQRSEKQCWILQEPQEPEAYFRGQK